MYKNFLTTERDMEVNRFVVKSKICMSTWYIASIIWHLYVIGHLIWDIHRSFFVHLNIILSLNLVTWHLKYFLGPREKLIYDHMNHFNVPCFSFWQIDTECSFSYKSVPYSSDMIWYINLLSLNTKIAYFVSPTYLT